MDLSDISLPLLLAFELYYPLPLLDGFRVQLCLVMSPSFFLLVMLPPLNEKHFTLLSHLTLELRVLTYRGVEVIACVIQVQLEGGSETLLHCGV